MAQTSDGHEEPHGEAITRLEVYQEHTVGRRANEGEL